MPKRCCWATALHHVDLRHAAAVLIALLPAAAGACDLAGLPERVETAKAVIAFQASPPLTVGQSHAFDIAACTRDGAALHLVALDAYMPAHGHGTNYRTEIAAAGPGRWRAEGLLLHMPGSWQLLFDVETASGPERLVKEIDLE